MNSGYLIVKTFERVYREYLEFRSKKEYPFPNDRVIYSIACNAKSANDYTKQYRGVDRYPLFSWDEKDENILEDQAWWLNRKMLN